MLHVTGNSHCNFFTGTDHLQGFSWWEKKPPENLPNVKVYPLTQPTAWNFATEYVPWIRRLPIPQGGKLLLVFGEIDCRWQIPNRAFRLCECPALIEECQDRFVRGVHSLMEEFNVGVWGVHYVTTIPIEDGIFSRNAVYRCAVVKLWNEMMKERCEDIGVRFFNIADKLIMPSGLMDESYLIDDIHLNQKAMPFALEALGGWQND